MHLALLALFVLEEPQLSVGLPEARDNPIGDMYGLVSRTWLASHSRLACRRNLQTFLGGMVALETIKVITK